MSGGRLMPSRPAIVRPWKLPGPLNPDDIADRIRFGRQAVENELAHVRASGHSSHLGHIVAMYLPTAPVSEGVLNA